MSIQVPGTGPNPQLEGLAGFWAGVSWLVMLRTSIRS